MLISEFVTDENKLAFFLEIYYSNLEVIVSVYAPDSYNFFKGLPFFVLSRKVAQEYDDFAKFIEKNYTILSLLR